MPRQPKQGLDFSGWSVTMFDGDKKIDKLLDAQGWKGFGVYFFLCQSAYKMNGYYLEWDYDDCASTARKMGGGIGSETVMETVKLCLLVGLFDNGLFDRWGVLTSKGIQRRFWAVAGERRVVLLDSRFWLLAPEETDGLDKRARFLELSPTNAVLSPTNAVLSPTNDIERKGKQSKGKESKVNKRERNFTPPTLDEVKAYCKSRNSDVNPDLFFEYFDTGNWIDSKGNPVKNWKQKLLTWESHNGNNGVVRTPSTTRTAKAPNEYKGRDFLDDE